MNKLILTGIFITGTLNSVFAQQWTTNGDHIGNTNVGSVVIGSTSPAVINSAAALFPGVTPKLNILTGQGTAPFSEVVTMYHQGVSVDAVPRQMGFLMKLSTESTTETSKMGGMILESSNGYGNNPSLSLVTGNARRLSIDYYGNVGIGTTTPTASLEVNGGGRFTGSNPLGGIGAGIEVYYNTNGGFFQTFDRAASTFLPLSIQGSSINFSNSGASISNPSLIIKGGNVGIGTPSPVSTFQAGNTFQKFSAGNAGGVNLNYGTSYMGFNAARTGSGSTASWIIDGDNSHNGAGVIYGDVSGNIYFAPLPSAGTSQRTLTDLDIKNSITFRVANDGVTYAKAITVQIAVAPDYVFKKDYKLPRLNDVKQYIDQNQHLPEIPSAREMEKDGMNVGEMNKLLLKKVEELTLYMIEKDKQINALQKRVSSLEAHQK
ncbi:hypothetical protein MTO98_16355 [Mucilaginibacter sp. SMC90]|uniref:hypothetical protein n=1 Tax=Mucilaginibacter sp. SMC90 TaxID=2929803 RepID=UPI001FB36AB3|nr:hypothetical protein [Mucilaginibacter sp. SMC90]UOE52644.1 hypothetical protein MTO98_16355 [Mucilaginibacter sp. SMC90]